MTDKVVTIGTFIESGKPVKLDLNYLMESKLLITAMTGGGKSHGTRVITEESFPEIQQIILEGENEYYTLREKFPYLLFGSKEDNADVQIHPKLAVMLPETLMRINKSAIVDISELPAHQRETFIMTFLEQMLEVPKNLQHPVMIVLDEAQKYCPEKGYGQSIASNAVKDFAARCRKRKITAIFCTQRPSALSKDITGACGMKLVGYAGQEEDRARNARELGMSTKPQDTMIFAKMGKPHYEFFAFGNGLSTEPARMSFKKSETTHGNVGNAFGEKKAPATPTQLQKILSQLQDLPQQADQELKNKDDMKKKISDLERQLQFERSNKQSPPTDPHILQKHEMIGYQKGVKECEHQFYIFTTNLKNLLRTYQKAWDTVFSFSKQVCGFEDILPQINKMLDTPLDLKVEAVSPKVDTKSGHQPKEAISSLQIETDSTLSGPGRKILTAIAQRNPQIATKQQIALITGYSVKSSGLDKAISILSSSSFIQRLAVGEFAITQMGLAALGNYEPLDSDPQKLRDFWVSKVGQSCGKILKAICDVYPGTITKTKIADVTGYSEKSSGLDKFISELSSSQLIDRVAVGEFRASKELFP